MTDEAILDEYIKAYGEARWVASRIVAILRSGNPQDIPPGTLGPKDLRSIRRMVKALQQAETEL